MHWKKSRLYYYKTIRSYYAKLSIKNQKKIGYFSEQPWTQFEGPKSIQITSKFINVN